MEPNASRRPIYIKLIERICYFFLKLTPISVVLLFVREYIDTVYYGTLHIL